MAEPAAKHAKREENHRKPSCLTAFLLIAVIILADQAVKYRIRTTFAVGESHPVIPNVFHITYVQNTGAAFSMFRDSKFMTILLPTVLIVACGFVLYRFYKAREPFPMACIAMIIAGGIGNMIDRLTQGFVVDMLDFRVFPVFNVADIAVTCGCGLLFVWVLFIDGRKGKHDS